MLDFYLPFAVSVLFCNSCYSFVTMCIQVKGVAIEKVKSRERERKRSSKRIAEVHRIVYNLLPGNEKVVIFSCSKRTPLKVNYLAEQKKSKWPTIKLLLPTTTTKFRFHLRKFKNLPKILPLKTWSTPIQTNFITKYCR